MRGKEMVYTKANLPLHLAIIWFLDLFHINNISNPQWSIQVVEFDNDTHLCKQWLHWTKKDGGRILILDEKGRQWVGRRTVSLKWPSEAVTCPCLSIHLSLSMTVPKVWFWGTQLANLIKLLEKHNFFFFSPHQVPMRPISLFPESCILVCAWSPH